MTSKIYNTIELRKDKKMTGPYSEKVMDHFMNPRNVGEIEDADGVGTVGNPACGDIMQMFIKIKDDTIVDAKFKTFGCGAAIATSSMATELIKGQPIDEALKITNEKVTKELGGLPKVKRHCSVLAEQALQSALDDFYKKKGIPSPIKLKTEEEMHGEEDKSD